MRNHHPSGLLSLLILLLAGVAPLGAQLRPEPVPRPPSHRLEGLEKINLGEEALAERLRLAHIQGLFQELLKNKELLKQLKLPPAALERLAQNPEQLNQFKDKLPELQQALQQQGGKLPGNLEQLRDLLRQANAPQPSPSGNSPNPGAAPPEPGKNPTTGQVPNVMSGPVPSQPLHPERLKELLTRQLHQIAENLKNSGYAEDSEAVRKLIKKLNRLSGEQGELKLDRFEGFERYLESLPKLSLLNPENLGSLKLNLSLPKIRPSTLPRFDLPSLNAPSLPSLPSMPSFSVGDSGTGLVWVLLLVLLLVLAWKSRGWYRDAQAQKTRARWQLGDWPVAPGQVSTRGDLIRAFEYLAFLCLGQSAGTCHHRQVAERLGQQEGVDGLARREAAEQLATLYEQVRYAPEQGDGNAPLPDSARHAARQALCFLAGGHSA